MNERKFAEKLVALKNETDRYFELNNGECTERDMSINDISRSKVDIMEAYHDKVYLGTVNDYKKGDDRDRLYEYNGDTVKNFEYNFIIPTYDEELVKLLIEWDNSGEVFVIVAIQDRVKAVGGVWLWWA